MSSTAASILTERELHDSYWGKRIISAEENGYFSQDDQNDSFWWQTCACGTQDDRIERHSNGEPVDTILKDKGELFYHYIVEDEFADAARTLILIENRAQTLLGTLPES